jgi:uncharacterized membrane protein
MSLLGEDLGRLIPRRILKSGQVHHPAVVEEAIKRNQRAELRIADRITTFAGSMSFVWLHAALFAVWMLFFEKSPWPTLTLVVSLEAIFLSTFVMIGQNRQAAFQQAKADQHRVDSPDSPSDNGIAQTRNGLCLDRSGFSTCYMRRR